MKARPIAMTLAFLLTGTCSSNLRGAPDPEYPQIFQQVLQISSRSHFGPYIVLSRDYRLCFVPPKTWGVKYDRDKGATVILHPGLEAGISITIEREPLAESAPQLSERLHESIRRHYPEAEIVGEYKVYAAGREGLAVEFRRIERQGMRTSFRRAMFEFDQGTVELEMVASSTRFPSYDHTYGGLLNSLQVEFGMDLPALPKQSGAAIRAVGSD